MSTGRAAEILVLLDDGAAPDQRSRPARLCLACVEALPVTGVGMSLMTEDGNAGMVTATDGPATIMEELQFTLGEGPCLDASRTNRPVLEPDLAAAAWRMWPGFAPAALDSGIRAIFAFPLQVGAIRLGVLNLYRDTVGGLSGRELAEALAFADAATLVLLDLLDESPPGGLHPDLVAPGADRAEIHQATGMIAVQLGVTLSEALVRLRGRAYADGVPVLKLAREVVAHRSRFTGDDR